VEVTETQGWEIVTNMQRLSDMEERKVLATGDIADKQLEYFKIRDPQIAITQRGLV
jgi:DNA-directed RNA polymerase subunit H (RpoH/RPB5)